MQILQFHKTQKPPKMKSESFSLFVAQKVSSRISVSFMAFPPMFSFWKNEIVCFHDNIVSKHCEYYIILSRCMETSDMFRVKLERFSGIFTEP